ncbi:sodium transporter HKT1 [Artemisia annua]|uniref:Sodium transporter HKT1 n=1 Tax=Artemisia annua TaxID=35608 RepID=A0A2U1Q4K4_ARTAN|nr:sodium transporter HKT1 [Artemisia annua]
MMIPPTTFVCKTIQCIKSLHSTMKGLYKTSQTALSSFIRVLLIRVDPFWLQLCYFVTLFMIGFLVLAILEPRNPSYRPGNYDLLFTSVSAVTVSSMATVEMEVFSNTQLFCLAILMLLGGEVFTSILVLQFKKFKLLDKKERQVNSTINLSSLNTDLEIGSNSWKHNMEMKCNAMKFLGVIALSYFVTVQVCGFLLVSLYVGVVPSAKEVLNNKNLNVQVFSIVTTISTFVNCGFLPTNESMVVFKKNLGLLLILIPLVLLGNTLYPVFLRLILLLLGKISKREELEYLLKNYAELGYDHLLSGAHCWYLALTSTVFIFIQFVLLISNGWKSKAMDGLSPLEKLVGSLFQAVNTRHTGESVFDLSLVSPAIIVLIVTMMYLPAYTYFLPREDKGNFSHTGNNRNKAPKTSSIGFLLLTPLPFWVLVIMLICITENENMQKDPLNFSVLNIIFEVISAYGNVGFSLGYSCKRQLQPNENCRDAWYGFVGRWNNISKLVLILVMIFGRLKKFHKRGGKAWKLSKR